MTPEAFVETFRAQKASAILRTSIASAVEPAMNAAIDGGFRIIEFTLTTPDALGHISKFAQQDGLIVGAGTVLTPEDAHAAVDAGATFLVSPVTDEAVIEVALDRNVAMMPGTFTPTEMLRAHRAGAQLQKLFPAPRTGPKFVKATLGPMPFLNIVPTNGVHLNNAASFLKAGATALGFVASLFDSNDIGNRNFAAIEARAEKLLSAIQDC